MYKVFSMKLYNICYFIKKLKKKIENLVKLWDIEKSKGMTSLINSQV